jgi:hypothetical protein
MVLEKEERSGMKLRFAGFALSLALTVLLTPLAAKADSSALIIQGIAGSEEQEAKFGKWSAETLVVLLKEMGFAKERVIHLAGAEATKASIEKAFAQLRTQLKAQDTLVVLLIGQGSFDTDYKLAISGPDLTGAEYNKLLGTLSAGRIIIVSSTPSSGGIFQSLAGRNRVLIASSRTGEREDTVFYEHFLNGLKGAAADADKDQRVSAWEAFRYATAGVERFYKEQGRLMTEHAAVVSDGNAQVTAAVADQEAPVMARVAVLNADRPVVVADAKLQALLNEKKEIEQKLEVLRLNKGLLLEAEYERQLEELILQLARKNEQIREQEKAK